MKTDEIRERFLDFFAARNHKIVKSDSLVPQNDPTLLFTGAGMNQFKEYFLGLKKDLKRAASSQKCLRTGDLDEVGRTPHHHSFFEMLGNFSFEDYFKKEAIQWAWEFLTEEMKLSKERLRVSVHEKDDEAFKIWRDQIRIRESWIYKMGDKSNFWPSNAPTDGPNGPSGPCSEIYYDQDPRSNSEDIESARFAEIWNLVFTQYDRQGAGKLVPLAAKNIDTGMGLERLACVLQGKKSNFEIDIFEPINKAIEEILQTRVNEPAKRKSLHAISDHVRAVVFAIADGVIPSNDGRGYVIRKLIRRAIWQGYEIMPNKRTLNISLLSQIVPSVLSVMSEAYPELREAEKGIMDTLHTEENNFEMTLEAGRNLLDRRLEELKQKGHKQVSGEIVFELYDTYGLPDETTQAISAKKGFGIDQLGFARLMESQRKRSKQASQIAGSIFVTTELEKKLTALPPTKFLGYQTLESRGKVLLTEIKDGKGIVVLDESPFYAESGGQVGDRGLLKGKSFEARVTDTQKKDKYILHHVEILKGKLEPVEEVTASVDQGRRERAMRNHTATHLLHAALRNILGAQVRQLGSLVAPEKLRFDYSYAQPLTAEQLKQIEDTVNSEILKDTAVTKEEKATEEAKKEGAIAFFGDKYGDRVRVVSVPGFSKEFCGGTHCDRTGQIGAFVITSDGSIASGVRRMEALTGEGALRYVQKLRSQIQQASEKLRSTPTEVVERIDKLQKRVKELEKEGGERSVPQADPKQLIESAKRAGNYRLILAKFHGAKKEYLRKIHDQLRSQAKKTLWVLVTQLPEKLHALVGTSADLKEGPVSAQDIAKEIFDKIGASGGGRKDLVEGGGVDPEAADKNWSELEKTATAYLTQQP